MRGKCPACGAGDPGFDWVTCPTCGAPEPNAAVAPSEPSWPSAVQDSNPSRWDPTEFGGGRQAGNHVRRSRTTFDDSPNYYEDLGAGRAEGGLRFDADDALFDMPDDATDYGDGGEAPRDRTIFDRGSSSEADEQASDHTVIIRSGKKGFAGPLVYFVERTGIRAGKVWPVSATTLVGRRRSDDEEEASIILNDETVSRRHGKVVLEDNQFRYWDLASANGSFLVMRDGSRRRILEPHPLEDGDTVDVGEARITFLVVEMESSGEEFE